jgi:hypothetical protein
MPKHRHRALWSLGPRRFSAGIIAGAAFSHSQGQKQRSGQAWLGVRFAAICRQDLAPRAVRLGDHVRTHAPQTRTHSIGRPWWLSNSPSH